MSWKSERGINGGVKRQIVDCAAVERELKRCRGICIARKICAIICSTYTIFQVELLVRSPISFLPKIT